MIFNPNNCKQFGSSSSRLLFVYMNQLRRKSNAKNQTRSVFIDSDHPISLQYDYDTIVFLIILIMNYTHYSVIVVITGPAFIIF